MQTAVSVLLVLAEYGKDLVDDRTMEQWFSSYIGRSLYCPDMCI